MDVFEKFQPTYIRHAYVKIEQVEGMLMDERQTVFAIGGGCDFKPRTLKDARQSLAQAGFIINDQDMPPKFQFVPFSSMGSHTLKMAPP